MLTTIILSLLLLAPRDLCYGMPIREATDLLSADQLIVGTEPTSTSQEMCGGGMDKYGEKIPKWPCLLQTWKVRKEASSGVLYTGYTKDKSNGGWVLVSARICMGTTCSNVDLSLCADLTKDSSF